MENNHFDYSDWIELYIPIPKLKSIDRLIEKDYKTIKITIPEDSFKNLFIRS